MRNVIATDTQQAIALQPFNKNDVVSGYSAGLPFHRLNGDSLDLILRDAALPEFLSQLGSVISLAIHILQKRFYINLISNEMLE